MRHRPVSVEDQGRACARLHEKGRRVGVPPEVLGVRGAVEVAVHLGDHQVRHLAHLPGERLPDGHHLPREAAPRCVDQEEDVLVGPQDHLLEGLADDDHGVTLLRLRQGLRLRQRLPDPALEGVNALLPLVVDVLLPLLQPPDLRGGALVERELHGVHVLRSHNLEDFEHPGALRDLREDRTVHAAAGVLLRRGLPERVPVQRQHEVHDAPGPAQGPVVLRRLPVLEPHQVRVRAVRREPLRQLRLLHAVDRRDRHLAAVRPDLLHGTLQLRVEISPQRVLRGVEVH
mmetsp:Transcript_44387/g.131510  ORF Transcript_44387/g.131510 Transcript_44387/m.131510 type:complete len:287 (-) Transcript_44387:135-995(-)